MAVERLAMTPKTYMAAMVNDPSDPVKAILSPRQFEESRDILVAGYAHIGNRVEEHFGRNMTPEVVQISMTLQQFLCAFVEHAGNPMLVRKLLGQLA
jgi:hypothetical protein